jgi:hypothetical protein
VLFSPYFYERVTFDAALNFSKAVTAQKYGSGALTCKTCIVLGDVTYYQKGPEALENDWSAEGDAFVIAARIEASVPSAQVIYIPQEQYVAGFSEAANRFTAGRGEKYYWETELHSFQIEGLHLPGGWGDLVVVKHIPGGRTQA